LDQRPGRGRATRQPPRVLRPAAFFNDPSLLGRKLKEHFDLEGGHLAQQVPQAQIMWRASCPLRTSLKAAQYTPAKRNQQVIESESRMATDLYNYRQMLPYVIARKMSRPQNRRRG
jgi:hypothetical protein